MMDWLTRAVGSADRTLTKAAWNHVSRITLEVSPTLRPHLRCAWQLAVDDARWPVLERALPAGMVRAMRHASVTRLEVRLADEPVTRLHFTELAQAAVDAFEQTLRGQNRSLARSVEAARRQSELRLASVSIPTTAGRDPMRHAVVTLARAPKRRRRSLAVRPR